MKGALAIFRFLTDAIERGERAALVTLTDVVGTSSRAPGTHMAVSETGAFVGSLSGGCVEAAVVAEAQDVLRRGAAEIVRFGAGSRYLDIRLPCGGGIDLLFTPDPSPSALRHAAALLESRQSVDLSLGLDGSIAAARADEPHRGNDGFVVRHDPDLRVLIVGHGDESRALARLASAYAAKAELLSPDRALVDEMLEAGITAQVLPMPGAVSLLDADAFTAVVFLFHDHDWEPELMAHALATPAFFVGAMGSRSTHARRCAILLANDVAQHDVDRIVGPIGLIPATRDPDTLALSILAQVAAAADVSKVGTRRGFMNLAPSSRVDGASAASRGHDRLPELTR